MGCSNNIIVFFQSTSVSNLPCFLSGPINASWLYIVASDNVSSTTWDLRRSLGPIWFWGVLSYQMSGASLCLIPLHPRAERFAHIALDCGSYIKYLLDGDKVSAIVTGGDKFSFNLNRLTPCWFDAELPGRASDSGYTSKYSSSGLAATQYWTQMALSGPIKKMTRRDWQGPKLFVFDQSRNTFSFCSSHSCTCAVIWFIFYFLKLTLEKVIPESILMWCV